MEYLADVFHPLNLCFTELAAHFMAAGSVRRPGVKAQTACSKLAYQQASYVIIISDREQCEEAKTGIIGRIKVGDDWLSVCMNSLCHQCLPSHSDTH